MVVDNGVVKGSNEEFNDVGFICSLVFNIIF